MFKRSCLWGLQLIVVLASTNALALEYRGNITTEYRSFIHDPIDLDQQTSGLSVHANPEFYHGWDSGQQSWTFSPFLRYDQYDDERSHADVRSLMWQMMTSDWELRVGINKVFWGVTESQHLVDVINQTDLVEEPTGEAKLGQPMINLSLPSQWGVIDLFVLPYFRERTFAGRSGRLRSQPYVDSQRSYYESSDEQQHIDYALRWSRTLNIFDVGVSYFQGTQRDPVLTMASNDLGSVLLPYYVQMDQWGLDLQATVDAWLWKLESVYRTNSIERYSSLTAGFEYSFYGVAAGVSDVGIIVEYLYDERGSQATTPFDDDVMLGWRWVANDIKGTQALVGVIVDAATGEKLYNLEFSRRLTDHWRASVVGLFYSETKSDGMLSSTREDDHWRLEMGYYF